MRLLGPHLTVENHEAALEQAKGQTREGIERLVAELAPRPDAPSLVRKVPARAPATPIATGFPAATSVPVATASTEAPPLKPQPAVVRPTSPERYRVQFTISEKTHEKLRRVQALLRREIPDGDPGVLFDRALTLLLEQVENAKLGAAPRPRSGASIRSETDRQIRTPVVRSRYVPRPVRRAVWRRDNGQCAFVSTTGRRCGERSFLEFHHVEAYAKNGMATVDNISRRCSRHNHYEGEREFGSRGHSTEGQGAGLSP